jgi:hypothetical protein
LIFTFPIFLKNISLNSWSSRRLSRTWSAPRKKTVSQPKRFKSLEDHTFNRWHKSSTVAVNYLYIYAFVWWSFYRGFKNPSHLQEIEVVK